MMKTFKVNAPDAGKRLDVCLSGLLDAVSRSRVQKLIASGKVLLNGEPATPHVLVEEGDEIAADADGVSRADAPATLRPRPDIRLDVEYEDKDIVVVRKPAGMLVHPAVPGDEDTLANAMLARYPEMAGVGDGPDRPGIMHRLDKEASGLLVVARTARAYERLKSQFQEHSIKKEYAVLVDGAPPEDSGTITLAIGRKKGSGKMMARPRGTEGNKPAVTHYRIEERFPKTTYLTVRTETGRTHQIRAHFNALGCPVVGDQLYGTKRAARLPAHRLFLHAKTLGFTHPTTGKRMEFTSPLPDELETVLKNLRGDKAINK